MTGSAAIVILTRNGKDRLLRCLAHAARSDHRPLTIVVVDNGSTDGTVEAVKGLHPDVHVLPLARNEGVSGGRNAGVRYVERHLGSDTIVFLDDDTQVESGAAGELIAAARTDDRIGLVTPKAFRKKGDRRLLSAGGMRFHPFTGRLEDVAGGEIDRGQHDEPRDVQACPGFAFLVRKEVFRRIGLFDEAFNPYGWEDVDFSLRAAEAGFRIVYAPGAVVYHAGGREGRGVVDLYERHKARNMLYFVRKHTTMLQWCCFLAILPFRAVLRVVKEVAGGNARAVRAWIGYPGRRD